MPAGWPRSPRVSSVVLESFTPVTPLSSLSEVIGQPCATTCLFDPMPTVLRGTVTPALLPFIVSLINTSLPSGNVPLRFKMTVVTKHEKKYVKIVLRAWFKSIKAQQCGVKNFPLCLRVLAGAYILLRRIYTHTYQYMCVPSPSRSPHTSPGSRHKAKQPGFLPGAAGEGESRGRPWASPGSHRYWPHCRDAAVPLQHPVWAVLGKRMAHTHQPHVRCCLPLFLPYFLPLRR